MQQKSSKSNCRFDGNKMADKITSVGKSKKQKKGKTKKVE